RPQAGSATFRGRVFTDLTDPLFEVGALLDAGYVHPSRRGRDHLRWLATSNGIADDRVDEVLELVGLADAARRRVTGYSLGMKQRLGLASVLLGDPHTIILDEPANGLDPEGIRWIRDVLRHLAGQGRTVLVSSHLLSEISLMATDLVVIGQGRLVEQGTVDQFVDRHSETTVRVRSPQLPTLLDLVRGEGAQVIPDAPGVVDTADAAHPGGASHPGGAVSLRGLPIERVGELAAAAGVVLHELASVRDSLEDAFLRATADVQEYRSGADASPPPSPPAGPPPGPPAGPPLSPPAGPPSGPPPGAPGAGGVS
ncbi:MAG: ATP-binding cassette domain-containing protein, partial [Actinomycetota bacterium]